MTVDPVSCSFPLGCGATAARLRSASRSPHTRRRGSAERGRTPTSIPCARINLRDSTAGKDRCDAIVGEVYLCVPMKEWVWKRERDERESVTALSEGERQLLSLARGLIFSTPRRGSTGATLLCYRCISLFVRGGGGGGGGVRGKEGGRGECVGWINIQLLW